MDEKEKEIADLKTKLQDSETKLASASGELTEDRKKRADIEAERDALKVRITELENKSRESGEVPDPEEAVRKVLAEKDQETAKENRQKAERAFKDRYKSEFDESSDPGGLKFSAIMAKYNRFNTAGAKSVEDFLDFFEEAYTLVNPQKPPAPSYSPYAATPPSSGGGPKEDSTLPINEKEKQVIDRLGWTPEHYLDLKKRRPKYVDSLFKNLI